MQRQQSNEYLSLDQHGKVLATYVWIDSGTTMRWQTKTLSTVPANCSEVPEWSCDDIYLLPVVMVTDPFRGQPNVIVLCESQSFDGTATSHNKRCDCVKFLLQDEAKKGQPWFSMCQPYRVGSATPVAGGVDRSGGRDLAEAHYQCCLNAGINISSLRPIQTGGWCYQIGPCEGVRLADELWLSRYILERLAEQFKAPISRAAGKIKENGCTVMFSTEKTRDKDQGVAAMNEVIKTLSLRHEWHSTRYGKDESDQVEGEMIQASIGVSIPRSRGDKKSVYVVDKRPPSDCDPYNVIEALVRTVLLYEIDDN